MITYGEVVEVLGVPTRRAVFERLRSGPMSVGEIAGGLPVSRPAVSQHLKILRGAGLVTSRRVGTKQVYALRRDGLADLRAYVESFWSAALAEFEAAARREATHLKRGHTR